MLIVLYSNTVWTQEYERYKKLTDTTITSTYLGFDKNITITVPFEWQEDTNRDFPLVIVFDRQNRRSHNYILNTIDYLTSNDQMPSSIIIGIESDGNYRTLETLHSASNEKGLALENEKFIFEELIPLAEKKYKASSFRLLIGHSRYGYFTTSLFCSRTNDINGIISISPFFEQKNVNLIDSIIKLEKQVFNSRKYYRFGIGNDYPDDFKKMDSTLKELKNNFIDSKGFYFKEADHNATPGLTIATSLYQIFEEWSKIQFRYISNEQKDVSIIPSLRKEIKANYGSQLEFSLGILNGKGWFFYNEEEYEKAIESWEILLSTYPNFTEGYLYIMDAQIQLKQDTSQTIERFKNSLVKSGIYSEAEKQELMQELINMK